MPQQFWAINLGIKVWSVSVPYIGDIEKELAV